MWLFGNQYFGRLSNFVVVLSLIFFQLTLLLADDNVGVDIAPPPLPVEVGDGKKRIESDNPKLLTTKSALVNIDGNSTIRYATFVQSLLDEG